MTHLLARASLWIDLHFRRFTNVWVVLSIFAAEVVLFHLLLVLWLKIGKRGWKIVDYIWLSLAALGIFGTAGQARQLVATNTVASSSQRTQISYMQVLSFVGTFLRRLAGEIDFARLRLEPVASACASNPMPRTEGPQARRSVRKR